MADKKKSTSRADTAKSAVQGAAEGAISSAGSKGGSGGASPASSAGGNMQSSMSNQGVSRVGQGGTGQAGQQGNGMSGKGMAQQVYDKRDKVGKLAKSTVNGDLRKGIQHKAKKIVKDGVKHPIKTATARNEGINSEDTKNVAKGVVQYYSGNYAGLAETAADEANSITDEYKEDKAEKKAKRDEFLKEAGIKNDDEELMKGEKKNAKANEDGPNGGKKKDKDDEKSTKEKLEKVGKNTKRAAKATEIGVKGWLLAQIAHLFKLAAYGLTYVLQTVISIASSVISALIHAAAVVAVALGVGIFAAVTGVIGVAVVGIGLLAYGIYSFFAGSDEDDSASRHDPLPAEEEDPCAGVEDTQFTQVADGGTMEENARLVYSFFANYYDHNVNEKIAGILGNWQRESSITFLKIEGSPSNPQELAADPNKLDEYVSGDLMPNGYGNWTVPACSSTHSSTGGWTGGAGNINITYYLNTGGPSGTGLFVPGMGIGQWTGSRGQDLLDLGAASDKFEWYDAGCQLAYMISLDSKASWVADWNTVDTPNPDEGADQFVVGWEGHSPESTRRTYAESWFVTIAEWDADVDYYNSIIELAGEAAQLATSSGNSKNHEDECTDSAFAYGDSLADKMSAYCMDSKAEAQAAFNTAWVAAGSQQYWYKDHYVPSPIGVVCGTDLYIKVHDYVWKDWYGQGVKDTIYASCDRSVATAIRWAGADDDCPAGACPDLITHFASDPNWQNVKSQCSSDADLMPGDVCIHDGHVVMYLGNEMVKKYHPDAPDDWDYGEGSFGNRPPAVQADDVSNYTHVFRNIKQEENSQWLNAAE